MHDGALDLFRRIDFAGWYVAEYLGDQISRGTISRIDVGEGGIVITWMQDDEGRRLTSFDVRCWRLNIDSKTVFSLHRLYYEDVRAGNPYIPARDVGLYILRSTE